MTLLLGGGDSSCASGRWWFQLCSCKACTSLTCLWQDSSLTLHWPWAPHRRNCQLAEWAALIVKSGWFYCLLNTAQHRTWANLGLWILGADLQLRGIMLVQGQSTQAETVRYLAVLPCSWGVYAGVCCCRWGLLEIWLKGRRGWFILMWQTHKHEHVRLWSLCDRWEADREVPVCFILLQTT